MTKRKRRTFTKEFKEQVVKLHATGKPRNEMFLASRKCMKWQLKMHTYTCQIPWLTLRD